MVDDFVFINMKENIVNRMKSIVGTTILGKTITYAFGQINKTNVVLPAIALEDTISDAKVTAELGGRHRLVLYYNVWIHAGGLNNELANERMKEQLKGTIYSAFSKQYSLPFYLYDQAGVLSDYCYSTDISIRSSTPSIYSELDAHKCVGEIKASLIY